MIIASVGLSIVISLAMDVILLTGPRAIPTEIAIAVPMFSLTVILMSGVGATIEWRRPGHAIGRLLMLSGPLYAFLGVAWLSGEALAQALDPSAYRLLEAASATLSWAGVAIIVGWIPLLFPTGALPGPRWRTPAVGLAIGFSACLVVLALQATVGPGSGEAGEAGLVSLTSIAFIAQVAMALVAIVVRYRRGGQVERLQIRWFAAAVALCTIGFVSAAIESAIRTDDGPAVSALVLYAGILAIPVTIGIAILRYRLYEIDRIISRTLGWGVVTGVLLAVFGSLVVGLQAALVDVTQGETLAVAASTLVAFALFQPVRRRVQAVVDRRFDRARYDGERAATAFAERLRDRVDLTGLEADLRQVTRDTIRPTSVEVWLRNVTAADPSTNP